MKDWRITDERRTGPDWPSVVSSGSHVLGGKVWVRMYRTCWWRSGRPHSRLQAANGSPNTALRHSTALRTQTQPTRSVVSPHSLLQQTNCHHFQCFISERFTLPPRLPLPEGRAGIAWWTSGQCMLSHVAPSCTIEQCYLLADTLTVEAAGYFDTLLSFTRPHGVSPRILFSQHHTCQHRVKSSRHTWHCHQLTGETRKRILTNILRGDALHHCRNLPTFRRNAVSIFRERKLWHTSLKRLYITARLHG